MSEYRFTGPFYNDNEERTYESNYTEYRSEPVTPPVEEPKKFHPSPVVSPIYGVLDKNYTVDDVVDRSLSKTKEFSLEKKETLQDFWQSTHLFVLSLPMETKKLQWKQLPVL